jgi:hypothetical protein
MNSLRDFLNTTVNPYGRGYQAPEFVDVANALAQTTEGNNFRVDESFAAAYARLRADKVSRPAHARRNTIGKKFSDHRSIIAFAVAPRQDRIVVPCGVRKADGPERLYALHATKGWRLVRGLTT